MVWLFDREANQLQGPSKSVLEACRDIMEARVKALGDRTNEL